MNFSSPISRSHQRTPARESHDGRDLRLVLTVLGACCQQQTLPHMLHDENARQVCGVCDHLAEVVPAVPVEMRQHLSTSFCLPPIKPRPAVTTVCSSSEAAMARMRSGWQRHWWTTFACSRHSLSSAAAPAGPWPLVPAHQCAPLKTRPRHAAKRRVLKTGPRTRWWHCARLAVCSSTCSIQKQPTLPSVTCVHTDGDRIVSRVSQLVCAACCYGHTPNGLQVGESVAIACC